MRNGVDGCDRVGVTRKSHDQKGTISNKQKKKKGKRRTQATQMQQTRYLECTNTLRSLCIDNHSLHIKNHSCSRLRIEHN